MMKIFNKKSEYYAYLLFISALIFVVLFLSVFFVESGPFSDYSNHPFLDVIFIVFIMLFFFSLIFMFTKKMEKKVILYFILALFVRYLVVFLMSFYGVLPYSFDLIWDKIGIPLSQEWRTGRIHINFNSSSNVRYYTILTTILYFLLQPNPIYMQLLNAFFGVLSIVYVHKINELIFSKKVADKTTFIMSFWPTHILFSAMHMRDALSWFLLVGVAYYFILWYNHTTKKNIIMIVLYLVGLVLIRQQNAALMFVILMPFVLHKILKNSSKLLRIIVFTILTLLVMICFYLLLKTKYFMYLDINYIIKEMNYRTSGDTAYLKWMQYHNILDIMKYAPLRFIYFVYTPFFWQITSIQHVFAFFESTLLLYMTYTIFRRRKLIFLCTDNKKELIFYVAFCILGLMANSIIDSNIGTAMRHRLQYFYIYISLYVAATESNKKLQKS